MRVFTLLLLSLSLLASCRPLSLYAIGPSGPPEYRLGWDDGCDTGLSAQGSPAYRFMYGFQKRPEMGSNELYKQAWNEGFTYCRFAISRDGDLI